MIIATYIDGRNLEYDESIYAFSIGGTPVSFSDVRSWDSAGQIQWAAPAQKEWFDSLNEQDFNRAHEEALASRGVSATPSPAPTQPLPQNSPYPQNQGYPQGQPYPGNTGYGYQNPQGYGQPYGQGTYGGSYPPPNGIPQARPAAAKPQSSTGKTVAIVIGVVVCVFALCACCCCGSMALIEAADTSDEYNSSNDYYGYDNGYDSDPYYFDDDSYYTGDYPEFTAFETSGANGDIVKIPSDATEGLLELVSYDGTTTPVAYFVNSSGSTETSRYGTLVGTSFIGFEQGENLKIECDGNWTVRYKPVTSAKSLTGETTGHGDMVFSYDAALDESWLFTVSETTSDTQVYTSEGYDEIFLTSGAGSDTLSVPAGEGYFVIITDGDWTLTKTTV